MGLLIMKDYLAIIRKLDFVDLFKYGRFGISYAVEFDGNIQSHTDDDNLFNDLTSRMNMYEYSFEYLIVHFKAQEVVGQHIVIDIKDVQGLYTFDAEAKKEMSISFDPRIQLQVSPWADKFEKLQQKLNIEQNKRGIDNLWAVWGLKDDDRKKCEEIITPDIVQEVFSELYANERPSGDLSIWVYLLRYERHSYYAKGMLGFFCDAIHVFCNRTMKKELDGEVALDSGVYSGLSEFDSSAKITELYPKVEGTPFAQQTHEVSHCRFVMAAPLFLFLKNEFADGMSHKPDDKIISHSKNIGGFECSIAVYLLGLALGYDKTYDAFYESAELHFFKKRKEESLRNKADECPNGTSDIETDNKGIGLAEENEEERAPQHPTEIAQSENSGSVKLGQESLFSKTESNGAGLPIAWMKKGKGKATKNNTKPAYNEDGLNRLKEDGYEEIRDFSKPKTIKEVIKSYCYDPEAEEMRLAKHGK